MWSTTLSPPQVLPPPAQDSASPGARLRRALPAVREWQRQGRGHGDGGGLPTDGAGPADPADPGAVSPQQDAAAGGEEAHEGRDREGPEEEQPPGGHRQDAAHLCPQHPGRIRWAKVNVRCPHVQRRYCGNVDSFTWQNLIFLNFKFSCSVPDTQKRINAYTPITFSLFLWNPPVSHWPWNYDFPWFKCTPT